MPMADGRMSVLDRIMTPCRSTGQRAWRVDYDEADERRAVLRWGEALIAEVYPHRDGGWQWIVWLGDCPGGRVPESADPWSEVNRTLDAMDESGLDEITCQWRTDLGE